MNANLVLAVQNAPVLRGLAPADDRPLTITDLAAATGRDAANVRKTVKKLQDEGWVGSDLGLTEAGLALLPRLAALDDAPGPAASTLTHAQLRASPLNPRQDWESEAALEALDALRQSIVADGLLQPIVVRAAADGEGVHEIVAGESRWRAIGEAIADADLPADWPIPVVRRAVASDVEHRRLALLENLARRDLHPLEEAEGYAALVKEGGLSTQEVADAVGGRTREYVQQRIRLTTLPAADQARLRLPAGDPRHLTVTAARNLLQGKSEDAPTRAAPAADPEQMDVEELAPRAVILSPMSVLMLLEIETAAQLRPKGKNTRATEVRYGFSAHDAAYAKLLGEGLIVFSSPPYPGLVEITEAGAAWLASQPGNFMQREWRLQKAREAAGVDAQEAGRFSVAWLDVPPPPPPPVLTDEQALVMLEIYDAAKVSPMGGTSGKVQVAHDAERAVLKQLHDKRLIYGAPYPDYQGYFYTTLAPDCGPALQPYCADLKKGRADALEKLRTRMRRWPSRSAGHTYSTPWLNAPFACDPKLAARKKVELAEREKAEAARVVLIKAREQGHESISVFKTEARSLRADELGPRFAALLQGLALGAPWRPVLGGYSDPDAKAEGGMGMGFGKGSLSLRAALIAANLAAGVPPAEWPPSVAQAEPEAPALDRPAFLAALQAELGTRRGSPPDAGWVEEQLESYLDDIGVEFGDDDYDWTAAAIGKIADHITEHDEAADDEASTEELEPA